MPYTIGIDIGGTHTDGVIVDERGKMITWAKTRTTQTVERGFEECLKNLILTSRIPSSAIAEIVVGTTHAMNALLQKEELDKVGVIRIAGHAPKTLPPASTFTKAMLQAVYAGVETVNGGYEVDGREMTPFSIREVKEAAFKLIEKGAQAIALQGVFSPLYPSQELCAKEALEELKVPITLSHEMGGMGFIERENAALLNSSLKRFMKKGFSQLRAATTELGFQGKLSITQNSGSRISLDHAIEFPLLTLSSGPTNSFVGAGKLIGEKNAIVVDIGGTSTDVGILVQGFPRKRKGFKEIDSIPISFPMPDFLSIALGGGSILDHSLTFTGKSCAKNLFQEGRTFGGNLLTLTCAALLYGTVCIPNGLPKAADISRKQARDILKKALQMIERLILRLQTKKVLPVLFAGGGATLFPEEFLPENALLCPNAGSANALGAALSELSITVQENICLEKRNEAFTHLHQKAMKLLQEQGGDSHTAYIVHSEVTPYHYMPGNRAKMELTLAMKKHL